MTFACNHTLFFCSFFSSSFLSYLQSPHHTSTTSTLFIQTIFFHSFVFLSLRSLYFSDFLTSAASSYTHFASINFGIFFPSIYRLCFGDIDIFFKCFSFLFLSFLSFFIFFSMKDSCADKRIVRSYLEANVQIDFQKQVF